MLEGLLSVIITETVDADEVETYKIAITEALLKGTKRNIESEDEPSKNASVE
ncbi:MAG: hypothetical protein MJ118_09320 [Clostridia bacterium]|nr:hypothetical protein [Clostridia bacterium]